jgi:hypothetical protein
VNSGGKRADTKDVRHATTDSYFVKIGAETPVGHGPSGRAPTGREGLGTPGGPRKHRRRRGVRGRAVFLALLIVGVGTWAYWAQQRPGGISGTVSSWVASVRGDVAKVSSDPDLAKARRYFNGQYAATSQYPNMSENDLAGVGIGVGVTVDWCSPQAVVIQGASGGGTASRLLLAGKDLGEVQGQYPCPNDMTHPAPWKLSAAKKS